jgi:protein SCO1/2
VWAFFAGVIFLTLIRPLLRFEPAPPPVLGQVGTFSLVDQDGRSFESARLAGQVYVANTFFTTCRTVCPPLMRALAGLEERYRQAGVEGVRLVSISVDPETDTPAKLREYGAALGVDPARWVLLTGDPTEVRRLVEGGFRTAMGEAPEGENAVFDIVHSGKLVLVDREGRIRGYYDSDSLGIDEVFERSRRLLAERSR